MNAIFSLILSFVLAFSGASLPAVPETAAVTSLRNVRVTLDGEIAALPHELILTTAAGLEEIGARLEIRSGEERLMPLAAVLTEGWLDFSLSDAGHYFRLSDESLAESGGLSFTPEDMKLIDSMMLEAEGARQLMELYQTYDLDEDRIMMRYIQTLAQQVGAEAESVQITLDGEKHDALRHRFKADAADRKAAGHAMTQCGDPALEAYFGLSIALDAAREEAGEPGDAGVNSYDMTMAEGEGWSRCRLHVSNRLGTEQTAFTRRGDHLSFSSNNKQKTEFGSASYALSGEIVGSTAAPGRRSMDFEIFLPMEYDQDIALGGSLSTEDGAGELEMRFGRTPDALGQSILLSVSAPEETPEGRLRSIVLSAQEMGFSISFDLLSGRAPCTSFFEGMEQKDYDPASAQDAAMTGDLLKLMADAAALAADADVIAAKDMLADGLGRFARFALYGDMPLTVHTPEGYSLMDFNTFSMKDGEGMLWEFANGSKTIDVYLRTYEDSEGYFYEFTPEDELLETDTRFAGMLRESEWNGWHVYIFDLSYDFTIQLKNIPDHEEAKALVAEICAW